MGDNTKRRTILSVTSALAILPGIFIAERHFYIALLSLMALAFLLAISKSTRQLFFEYRHYRNLWMWLFAIGIAASAIHILGGPGAMPLYVGGYGIVLLVFYRPMIEVEKRFTGYEKDLPNKSL